MAQEALGDWFPNERFPHGLKWLANELQSRHGLKLGLWIAPTDAAETSDLFKQHPDWMLKDDSGKPLVNWKWYWKPNPNCYELDATNPAAAKYIHDTFARPPRVELLVEWYGGPSQFPWSPSKSTFW